MKEKVKEKEEKQLQEGLLHSILCKNLFKNDGVEKLTKCLKNKKFANPTAVKDVKALVKFDGKFYAVQDVSTQIGKFKGDVISLKIDVKTERQYDKCITLGQFNQKLKEDGITSLKSTCKGIGLAPVDVEDVEVEGSEDPSEKEKKAVLLTTKLEDVVPDKNYKFIIFKFGIDESKVKKNKEEDPISCFR